MHLNTKAASLFRRTLTAISPELSIRTAFLIKKGRRLNTKNPADFPDKLVTLRLKDYNHNPQVRRCADKYAVRDYVREKGFGDLLNELLAVYDRLTDVDWEGFPPQYALKLNVGNGCNYICPDKQKADFGELRSMAAKWMRKKPWLDYAELQYQGVEKKILLEKYLCGKEGAVPEDYKIYCFHGRPLAILYMSGRFSGKIRAGFFDPEWNYLGIIENRKKQYALFDSDALPARPESLETMVRAAEALSAGFPFVRVDFYDVDGAAVFGEMTFTPAGGYDAAECEIDGKSMAEYLHLYGKEE